MLIFWNGIKCLRKTADIFMYPMILGTGLGLLAFLIHSAVDTNLYSLPLAALFWLSCGILSAAVKISQDKAYEAVK